MLTGTWQRPSRKSRKLADQARVARKRELALFSSHCQWHEAAMAELKMCKQSELVAQFRDLVLATGTTLK